MPASTPKSNIGEIRDNELKALKNQEKIKIKTIRNVTLQEVTKPDGKKALEFIPAKVDSVPKTTAELIKTETYLRSGGSEELKSTPLIQEKFEKTNRYQKYLTDGSAVG